jgi:hypothetical protein
MLAYRNQAHLEFSSLHFFKTFSKHLRKLQKIDSCSRSKDLKITLILLESMTVTVKHYKAGCYQESIIKLKHIKWVFNQTTRKFKESVAIPLSLIRLLNQEQHMITNNPRANMITNRRASLITMTKNLHLLSTSLFQANLNQNKSNDWFILISYSWNLNS